MTKERFQEAKEIYDAIINLSKFLNMEAKQVIANLVFLDEIKYNKLKKAIDDVNSFYDKPIKERAKILNLNFVEN